MEEFVKIFAPWGLGGVLAGGNLLFLYLITTRVLPAQIKNFRLDVRRREILFVRALHINQQQYVKAILRSEEFFDRNMQRVADEVRDLRETVQSLVLPRKAD